MDNICIDLPINKGAWETDASGKVVDGLKPFLSALVFKAAVSNVPSVDAAQNIELQNLLTTAAEVVFLDHAKVDDIYGPFMGVSLRTRIAEDVKSVCDQIQGGKIKLRRRKKEEEAKEAQPWNGPVIQLITGEIEAAVTAAERALSASGRGIYQRGGSVVTLGETPVITAAGTEISSQRIYEVGEHALLEHVAASARFESWNAKSEKWSRCAPPAWVAKTLAGRAGRMRLPVLTAVVGAPTLRPDGTLLDQDGYDPTTGLLLDLRGEVFPVISDEPTKEEARQALDILIDLIGTFSFVSDADRSVALAAILTASVRRSLRTAPLFAFTAPTAGSGKSTLVDIASVIATGREAGVMAQGRDETEDEKRLGSLLLGGAAVIAIDNCTRPIDGDLLCQMLTQTSVCVRILGQSKTPEVPASALICATGNNLVISGDMTRRTLPCRLDPGCERPELRQFEQDPLGRVRAFRGDYVAACLAVLRAYILADTGQQKAPLGSFQEWSWMVRDALIWLGEADPIDTMEYARSLDPKLDSLTSIIANWRELIGDKRVTAHELIAAATQLHTANTGQQAVYEYPDFREALLAVAGDSGHVSGRRLGRWLTANMGRLVGGCRIERDGSHANAVKWKLESV